MRRCFAIVIFSVGMLVAVQTSWAQLAPVADTYVTAANPNQNFGHDPSVSIAPQTNSYLRFDVSNIPSDTTITRAVLRLYVDGFLAPGQFDVFEIDQPWNEFLITWNNAPPLGLSATGGHSVGITLPQYTTFIQIDITSLVQKWVNGTLPNNGVAFALTTASGTFGMESKENTLTSHEPELQILTAGAQGEQGPAGPQGPQGDAGPAGPQGPQGATGPQGPQGATGATGPQGPQGPAGQDGANGTNGQGFAFRNAFDNGTNYNAYDVVTFAGSSYNATVAIPAGGGDPDQNLSWALLAKKGEPGEQGPAGAQGPQGDAGPAGPQGPQGATGPQGPQGATGATGPQGPQGPAGQDGANGTNGQGFAFRNAFDNGTNYNAYDVVTFAGSSYNATVAIPAGGGTPDQNTNWALMAKVGDQGATGQQGPQGETGATGAQGPAGPQGATGPQGPMGLQGAQGLQGVQGPQGDPGNLNPGSPYYVQNGTSQQTGANFNIDGNGTAAGTLTGTTAVNTNGIYQVGGATVLNASANTNSTYIGFSAGPHDGGGPNTFIGDHAGFNCILCDWSTLVGANAGRSSTIGQDNTFIGGSAGAQSTGNDNIFIGRFAGVTNTAGHDNINIGHQGVDLENNTIRIGTQGTGQAQQNAVYIAGISSQTISAGSPVWINANGMLGIGTSGGGSGVSSFIGRTGAVVAQAGDYSFSLMSGIVTSAQLGGSYNNPVSFTSSSNSFTGNGAGLTNVPFSPGSPNYIQNGTTQQASANFNIAGNGVASGILTGTAGVNTAVGYSLAGLTILTGDGDSILKVGVQAGAIDTRPRNTFVGANSASSTNQGTDNAFFGYNTGQAAKGNFNVLLGSQAGETLDSGANNTYVGALAGAGSGTGSNNTFIGLAAGEGMNIVNSGNTFVGAIAGAQMSKGVNNVFLGYSTGNNDLLHESSDNIYISNQQSLAESNTIRIGTQGTGDGQQNKTFLAGVTSQSITTGSPVWIDANGMLGIGTSGGGSGVSSFIGRTGAVVAQAGDYSFSLMSGIVTSAQLGGSYNNPVSFTSSSNSFTGNGAGLTNVPVSAGSPNYIQNGTTQQASANFNIAGNGIAGGSLTGTTGVNSGVGYSLAGSTILTGDSSSILKVGVQAGTNNSQPRNTYVGVNSASTTTQGMDNAFFGYDTGLNSKGDYNVLVGSQAGYNLILGTANTYVGQLAGGFNGIGTNNTYIGQLAGATMGSPNSGNTYVGASAGARTVKGMNNVFLGFNTGNNDEHDGSSNNIYISNQQSLAESNTIRIGTQGTGDGQQNKTFIAGVTSQSITTGSPVWIDANGMLGVGSSGGGGGVTSFNGRTGAVVAQAGDYSFTLVGGIVSGAQLGGNYVNPVTFSNSSNSFTGNGAGLTNVPVTAGSANYIQNGTTQQASATFNIAGDGTVAGTLTGTTAVNTAGSYQLNGSTILGGDTSSFVTVGVNAARHNTQSNNTFVGVNAANLTTTGNNDTFVGFNTGTHDNGSSLVLIGSAAGQDSTGDSNTFVGATSGQSAKGDQNTFVGVLAGQNSGGTVTGNTYVGYGAGTSLRNGKYNVFIGYNAGILPGLGGAQGNDNIYISNTESLQNAESNTIRIGTDGTGDNQQNRTFIAGISGATSSGGINVLINASGQLGTTTSSRRFKDNILDMGSASSRLFDLRPVTFLYKPQYDDGSHILQYGLIAEEVAKIYPDLVVYDKDGKPETVRYHLLTPMLLNELQKQHELVAAQQQIMQTQQHQIDDLQRRLSRVESILSQVAGTELGK